MSRYNALLIKGNKLESIGLFKNANMGKEDSAMEALMDNVKTGTAGDNVAYIVDTVVDRYACVIRSIEAGIFRLRVPQGWEVGTMDDVVRLVEGNKVEEPVVQLPTKQDDIVAAIEQNQKIDYILLLWERVGDSTETYLIPNPTDDQIKHVCNAANCFVGGENTKDQQRALNRIMLAISPNAREFGKDMRLKAEIIDAWATKWVDYKVDSDKPLKAQGSFLFINAGMFM